MNHNGIFMSDLRKIEVTSGEIICEKRGCEIIEEQIYIHENRHDLITFQRGNETEKAATLSCNKGNTSTVQTVQPS